MPPPEDAGPISAVNIGHGRAAGLARELTSLSDELFDFLDFINPLP